MTPYYDDGGITIYHGDCRDVLPFVGQVDLLIADPPYGVAWQSNWSKLHDVMAGDAGELDLPAVLTTICRQHLKLRRHGYIFGPCDLSTTPLTATVELIWDKGNTGLGNLELPWGLAHERLVFGVNYRSKAERDAGRGGLSARLRQGSVLRFNRCMKATRHPTEKPVILLRHLIESSSLIGEMVLDPFAGSGSTLVAAKIEGRRAIGIEVREDYCEMAANRLTVGSADFQLVSRHIDGSGAGESMAP